MIKINYYLVLTATLFIFCLGCQTPSGSNNIQKEKPSPKQPGNIASSTPIQIPSEPARTPIDLTSPSEQINTVVTSPAPLTYPSPSVVSPGGSSVSSNIGNSGGSNSSSGSPLSSSGSSGGNTITTGNVNVEVNPNPPQATSGNVSVTINTDKPTQNP